jgi:hypothetical protein
MDICELTPDLPIQSNNDNNQQMEIDPDTGFLWPIVYPSEFWLLKEHLISLDNASISEVPLTMSYAPIGFFKWQIQVCFLG